MDETRAERGTLWGDDEAASLIEIWADEDIQQPLDPCTRKRPSQRSTRVMNLAWVQPNFAFTLYFVVNAV